MSVTDDKRIPVQVSGQYGDEAAIWQNLQIIFREFQAKKHKRFATAPNLPDVSEGEIVFFDNGSTRRAYTKLNGVLYYWSLTAA